MNVKSYIFSFFLLTVGAIQLVAQESFRENAPEPGPAPKIELGSYNGFQLDNGLQVIVVENHKLPRVSFQIFVDYPPLMEGDKAGTASMAGQLLSTGTTKRSKAEIDEAIDFIGASISSSSNGVFGSSLTKYTDELLQMMTEVLFAPSFPEAEFDKLKTQTNSALAAAKDSPDAISSNLSSVVTYGADHPYGNITTESTVGNITLEDCKNFYNTYFKPNISYLVIVGDMDQARAKEVAETYFGNWEKGDVSSKAYRFPKVPTQPEVGIVTRPGAVQSVVNITYPVDLKPGTADAIPARIMNAILGGGSTGRFFKNLREDKGYTYGAYSGLSTDQYVSNFSAGASVRNEVTDSAITQFIYEMNKISTEPVTETELQMVKNELTGSFARGLESPQTIARYALNTARYQLPNDYYATYLQKLNGVTVDDIQRVAKKYITPDNAHILVVGNEEVVDKLTPFDGNGQVTFYSPFGEVIEKSDAPVDIDAWQVIDQYLEAIGGKDKLNTVKDMVMIMNGSIQGMQLQSKVQKKVANKLSIVVSMNGNPVVSQIYDGTAGSITQGGQTIQAEGDVLKQLSSNAPMFVEMDYKDMGYELSMNGLEKVDNKDVYSIKVKDPSGLEFTEYYEVETGYKIRTVAPTPNGQVATTDFGNYQEVDGIKFPFSTKTSFPMPIEMKVESVELNVGVEDDVFDMK